MASFAQGLPNEPLFHRILDTFTANPEHVVVHDWVKSTEVTCSHVLSDMLYMRRRIVQELPESMFDVQKRIVTERPYILVLAPGNYDFILATFAILSCGAAFSSIPSTLSPEEVSYILEITNASCILVSPEFRPQASAILQYQATHRSHPSPPIVVEISRNNDAAASDPQLRIAAEMTMDPLSPAALIFTSGTTGPPKGIVKPRSSLYSITEAFPTDSSIALTFRPPTWGAVVMALIIRVLRGTRTDVVAESQISVWERFKVGGVTDLVSTPLWWARLMQYFTENIDGLPSEQREQYVRGIQQLRRPVIIGDFPRPAVTKFWREMMGRPLMNFYGSTEAGLVMQMLDESDGCIGKPHPGVQIKLSEGDHGELLLKSPGLFTSYINNKSATEAAFDREGFFRSGDFGRLRDEKIVLEGRLSIDFLRRYGLWIPLREVEACIAEIPYVSEAHVVPAEFNFLRHAAALIRLNEPTKPVSLRKIGEDLGDKLEKFKLPTLLRILQDGEEVPETSSGKVSRKKIAEIFFVMCADGSVPPGIELLDETNQLDGPRKAWDWAGMR